MIIYSTEDCNNWFKYHVLGVKDDKNEHYVLEMYCTCSHWVKYMELKPLKNRMCKKDV